MPTGYTAILMDKGETFKSFVMHCARAFGATITKLRSMNSAERDIHYYTEENIKEIERTNGRNEWIQQLRASI